MHHHSPHSTELSLRLGHRRLQRLQSLISRVISGTSDLLTCLPEAYALVYYQYLHNGYNLTHEKGQYN